MSDATSKQAVVTEYARGTPCYRAPELVQMSGSAVFTNKVDIWSLGCVLGELLSGTKVFGSDWAVHQYYEGTDEAGVQMLSWVPSALRQHIHQALQELLDRDYKKRPRGDILRRLFNSYRLVTGDGVINIFDYEIAFPEYGAWKQFLETNTADSSIIDGLFHGFCTHGNVQGYLQGAIILGKERIRRNPHESEYWLELERIYHTNGDDDLAIEGWTSLVEALPDIGAGHFILTVTCLQSGGHALACLWWSKLNDKYPTMARRRYEVMAKHLNIYDWPAPYVPLTRLVQGNPQEEWYQDELDRALDANQSVNSVDVWKALVRRHPNVVALQERLWRVCARIDLDKTTRIEIWTELVKRDPTEGLCTRLNRALAEGTGNPEASAIEAWRFILLVASQPSRLPARLFETMEPFGTQNQLAVWALLVKDFPFLARHGPLLETSRPTDDQVIYQETTNTSGTLFDNAKFIELSFDGVGCRRSWGKFHVSRQF